MHGITHVVVRPKRIVLPDWRKPSHVCEPRVHDQCRNFGTLYISSSSSSSSAPVSEHSRLHLYIYVLIKDRNFVFVHTLNISCTSQWTTSWPQKWAWSGSRDLSLKLETLHNFWADKPTCSKFCVLIHGTKPFLEGWKLTPKWAWLKSRDPCLIFVGRLYIFGTAKDRNFLFGAHIQYNMY